MKSIVTYFSASGNTAHVANRLADAAGADIFEIRPAELYTEADLDWKNEKSRSTIEMKDPACRPKIAGCRDNIQEYDLLFVGFPVWWDVAPRIINTFLESCDLTGKIVIPFATSGGGGVEKVCDSIRHSCPESHLRDASLLSASATLAELSDWAESITK